MDPWPLATDNVAAFVCYGLRVQLMAPDGFRTGGLRDRCSAIRSVLSKLVGAVPRGLHLDSLPARAGC